MLTMLITFLFLEIPFLQVEEIDDVDGNSTDPFIAAAIANERELDLSDEQRRQFKKVVINSLFIYQVKQDADP